MTQFPDNAIRNRDCAIGEFSQTREINAIGINIERNANWQGGGGHSKLSFHTAAANFTHVGSVIYPSSSLHTCYSTDLWIFMLEAEKSRKTAADFFPFFFSLSRRTACAVETSTRKRRMRILA